MKTYIYSLLILFILGLALALPDITRADSGSSGGGTYTASADPDIDQAKKAIENTNWDAAIELLKKAAARDPKNAEICNPKK